MQSNIESEEPTHTSSNITAKLPKISSEQLQHVTTENNWRAIERLDEALKNGSNADYLKEWRALLKTSHQNDGRSPDQITALLKRIPTLGKILEKEGRDHLEVRSYYEKWLEHPSNQNPQNWCAALSETATHYHQAGKPVDAAYLYYQLMLFYNKHKLAWDQVYLSALESFSLALTLTGDVADAMLYVVMLKKHATEQGNKTEAARYAQWIRCLEDCALITVVQRHKLCYRSTLAMLIQRIEDPAEEKPILLTQQADQQPDPEREKKQAEKRAHKKQTLVGQLADSLTKAAERLWITAWRTQDIHLKKYYVQILMSACKQIRHLTSEYGLPNSQLIENHYRDIKDYYQGRTKTMQINSETVIEPIALKEPPASLFSSHASEQSPWEILQAQLRRSRYALRKTAQLPWDERVGITLPKQTTQNLVSAFRYLFEAAEKALGDAPWPFAILGLGSLARGEACPYSDLEFAIVLKDIDLREVSDQSAEIRHYFKAALEWMEVQLIALGESHRVMTWPEPAHTLRLRVEARLGFRFDDGGNTPFSAKNRDNFLIGTAKELVTNTFQDAGDRIMLNAFLGAASLGKELQGDQVPWGNAKSAGAFHTALWDRLKQSTEQGNLFHQQFALELLKSHLSDVGYTDLINDAKLMRKVDVKENFLRLPVFLVEALSLYCGIEEIQTEQRITALVQGKRISQVMGDALAICIRFGLTLRTRVHLHYGLEQDTVYLNEEAAKTEDETNPYVLSDIERITLLQFAQVMLKPTREILSAVFSSDTAYPDINQKSKTHDVIPYQAALKASPDTIEWLRETALELRSWGDWSHAMQYSRFSLNIAEEDIETLDPTHDSYAVYLEEIQKPQYIDAQKLNLPEPNGMRPLMLRKKRQWQTDLLKITEAPDDINAAMPPTGRLLLESPEIGKRLLKSDIAKLVQQQLNEPEALHGSRPVILTDQFCFKLFPEYLGTEIAASDFIQRLIGGYVQEVGLAKITDSKGTEWPVLIMRRVPGENLKERCCVKVEQQGKPKQLVPNEKATKNTLEILSEIDDEQFSRLFVAALLITNEDGKDDNIMMTLPQETEGIINPILTLIDNDRCFLPSITEDINIVKKIKQLNLQMKHLVFCMDQMQIKPLHAAVKQELLSLHPHALLDHWLARLSRHNQDCLALFGESKIVDYYDPAKDAKRPPSILPVVLMQDTETRLFSKLHHLRNIIEQDSEITPLKILQYLEPDASASYYQAFEDANNSHALARWRSIVDNYYKPDRNLASVSRRNYAMVTQSLKLNNKNDLLTLIRQEARLCCIPSFSQKRLLEKNYITQIKEELYQGSPANFQRLTNAMKKAVLESIPFEKLNNPQDLLKQQQIFKVLEIVVVNELNLRQAHGLTDAILKKILERSGEYLTTLELVGCRELTELTARNIATYCKKLESLKLDELPKLRYLQGIGLFGQQKQPLLLHSLKQLSVSNCTQLKAIDVQCSRNAFSFFGEVCNNREINITQLQIKEFFKQLMENDSDAVQKSLFKQPLLVYVRASVDATLTTYAYYNVTPLQYALLMRYRATCKIILSHLLELEAKEQIEVLKHFWERYTNAPRYSLTDIASLLSNCRKIKTVEPIKVVNSIEQNKGVTKIKTVEPISVIKSMEQNDDVTRIKAIEPLGAVKSIEQNSDVIKIKTVEPISVVKSIEQNSDVTRIKAIEPISAVKSIEQNSGVIQKADEINLRVRGQRKNLKVGILGTRNSDRAKLLFYASRGRFWQESDGQVSVAFINKYLRVDDQEVKLDINDTASIDGKHSALALVYIRDSAICILCISNFDSLEKLNRFKRVLRDIDDRCPKNVVKIIAFVEVDPSNVFSDDSNLVKSDLVKEFANEEGLFYCECSAKTGKGIQELFESAVRLYLKSNPIAEEKKKSKELVIESEEEEPSSSWRSWFS